MNPRIIFAVLVLGLASVMVIGDEAPAGNGGSLYSNARLGFSLPVPDLGDAPPGGMLIPVAFCGPGKDGFSTNINVLIQPPNQTSQQYLAATQAQLKAGGGKMDHSEPRKVSGHDALLMDYEAPQNKRPLHFLSLAVFTPQHVYLVTCTATAEEFPKIEPVFKATLDGFKLTGP